MTTAIEQERDSRSPFNRVPVLVIDRNPVFLAATTRFLERQPELEVLGAAGSLEEGLAGAGGRRPAVVVIDPSSEMLHGLGPVSRVRSALPDAGVVVMALLDSDAYRAAALAGGAHGFASKSNLTSELVPAIHVSDRMRFEALQEMAVAPVACPS